MITTTKTLLALCMLMVADAADASQPTGMSSGFVERPAEVEQSVNASLMACPARVKGLDNPDNVIDKMYRSTFKIDDDKVTADELIAAVYWAVRMGDPKNPTPTHSDIKSITMSDTTLTLCTKADVSNPPKQNVSALEDCHGHYTANTQCLQDIRDHIRLSRESPKLPGPWNVHGGFVDARVACLQLQVQQLRDSLRASLAQQVAADSARDILAQRNNLKPLFCWCSRD